MTVIGGDATLTLLVAVSLLAGGVVRGYAGFGASLIFLPVASALVGPKTAVLRGMGKHEKASRGAPDSV